MFRIVKEEDAKALCEIVNYYIKNTVINFSYDLMSEEEMLENIRFREGKFPFIVIEENNEILGYAYTSPFVGKQAYQYNQETTVYLRHDITKKGYGKKIYLVLEALCKEMGIQKLDACIGYAEKEDEYLNNNSASFHEHMGYTFVGKFENCGYKFNRWYSMVWYTKVLQTIEHPDHVILFGKLDNKKIENILEKYK